MPRSPLTEPLLRVQGMIAYVRENLSTDEYMLFLDLLVLLPEPEAAPVRKTRKKSKSSSKSPRASSLSSQLKSRTSEQREAATKDITGESDEHCLYELSYGPRLQLADANIHHLTTHPNYHEFDAGKSTAPPAPTRSPANGGAVDESASAATGD